MCATFCRSGVEAEVGTEAVEASVPLGDTGVRESGGQPGGHQVLTAAEDREGPAEPGGMGTGKCRIR